MIGAARFLSSAAAVLESAASAVATAHERQFAPTIALPPLLTPISYRALERASAVVLAVLLVLGAEVLEQVVLGHQRRLDRVRQLRGVGARVVDDRLDLEVPRNGPPEALDDVQLL